MSAGHRRPRRQPTMRRLFLVEFLDLEQASGTPGARWEHFQIRHLDDDGTFRIETKSRQIAWSWTIAAEAVADALADLWHDQPRDSVFVSINQQEAAEKIRYARHVLDTLRESAIGDAIPPLVRDSMLEIELANGARLTSLPARPPRGRARANVYLDEFAHVADDKAIYTAALPIISKGGRLRIGSSPFGAAGQFWEIANQAIRPYPGYTRAVAPWWTCYAFCTDPPAARRDAPQMDTAARVARFGNHRITAIFENLDIDDFRQEYEAAFVDESRSYFTWEEIRDATRADLLHAAATVTGAEIGPALAAIDEIAGQIRGGHVEEAYTAGYDVGRTHDRSELIAVGLSTSDDYPIRLMITLDKTPYDAQAAVIAHALDRLPLTRLWIDRNGIGGQLAEQTERAAPAVAHGAAFTAQSKELWATTAKRLMQQDRIKLPPNRDLAYQIHSIRKMVSASRQNVFDVDANEQHHADKAWALFLALAAAEAGRRQTDPQQIAQMFDYLG